MRKVIFSAVVIILAGTCWVVAQNTAADRPATPYDSPRVPSNATNSAEALASEPGVAPTTVVELPATSADYPTGSPTTAPVSEPGVLLPPGARPLENSAPSAMPVKMPDMQVTSPGSTNNPGDPLALAPLSQSPAPIMATPTYVPETLPSIPAVPPYAQGTPPSYPVTPPAYPGTPPSGPTAMPVQVPNTPLTAPASPNYPGVVAPVPANETIPAPLLSEPAPIGVPAATPAPARTSVPNSGPALPPVVAEPVVPMQMPNGASTGVRGLNTPASPTAVAPPAPELPRTDVTPAPISVPSMPSMSSMPSVPSSAMPAPSERPAVRSVTKSASPIIPGLPLVPGVSADYQGAPPYSTGQAMAGQNTGVPNPAQPGQPGQIEPIPQLPTSESPVRSWTVDNPSGTNDGQPVFNEQGAGGSERVLGPRIWGGAEYLFWFIKPQSTPTLVQGVNGIQPGDTTYQAYQVVDLFPGSTSPSNTTSGVRGTLGFWLNQTQTIGFEANYFWLANMNSQSTFQSTPVTTIGRPFYDPSLGNRLYAISSIYGVNGTIAVNSSFHADGGEANFLVNSINVGTNFNVIAGFRYFEVNEGISVTSQSTTPDQSFALQNIDSFSTRNQFYGGQLGLRYKYQGSRFFGSLTGKFAYGAMEESVNINGGTIMSNAGFPSQQAVGGVLAQSTNIGDYARTRMAFIPEADAKIGYRFAPWGSMFVGYNFMYVSNVVRPGNQMDPVVNVQNLPFGAGGSSASTMHPEFAYHETSLWMQGINFGITLRY